MRSKWLAASGGQVVEPPAEPTASPVEPAEIQVSGLRSAAGVARGALLDELARQITAEWGKPPAGINRGDCEGWAGALVERAAATGVDLQVMTPEPFLRAEPDGRLVFVLPEFEWRCGCTEPPAGLTWDEAVEVVRNGPFDFHTWVFDPVTLTHRDAERPEGVRNFFELPHFQRKLGIQAEGAAPVRRVESWRFHHWFQRSAMVDSQGDPLVAYHGTKAPEDFAEFLAGAPPDAGDGAVMRSGSGHDPVTFLGSHFALDPEVANQFAKGLYGERVGRPFEGGRVYPVFLRVVNPHRTTEEELLATLMRGNYGASSVDFILEGKPEGAGKLYDANPDYRAAINEAALALDVRGDDSGDFSPDLAMEMAWKLRDSLRALGHDGIIYENAREGGTSVVVFEAGQVKSAIGNSGEFDPWSLDIRR